jgi:dTDP-4-amino-4,6-dideoxygalactose transaminase
MNPFQVVRDFEECVAAYAGAKFGVAVDSCTSALLLCLRLIDVKDCTVRLPKHTYPSVPCAVIHAGGNLAWTDEEWQGLYQLKPFPIMDAAKRFRRGMFEQTNFLYCLSFHAKKHLKIGRGGMILTNNESAAKWLRLMRFDGREECALTAQKSFDVVGYNVYMTPEQAARGLWLMSSMPDDNADLIESPPFPDLSVQPAYQRYLAE